MIFNNYSIPDNITAEDTFMYELVSKLDAAGSHSGFVLGGLSGAIEKVKNSGASEELVEELNEAFKVVNAHLDEYYIIFEFAISRWKELGEPLSLAAHQAKKRRLDEEDRTKAEYYDR